MRGIRRTSRFLVKEALATNRTAQTGDTVRGIEFTLEFVVIRKLLV